MQKHLQMLGIMLVSAVLFIGCGSKSDLTFDTEGNLENQGMDMSMDKDFNGTGNEMIQEVESIPKTAFVDSGVYTFYNEAAGCYLSYDGNRLVLNENPAEWMLKAALSGYHVYANGTELMLDIDNAYVAVGTEVKMWQYTGYDVQIWNISRNANGTYSILYSGDNRYCLGFAGESSMLQMRDEKNKMQEWIITDIGNAIPKEYLSFHSKNHIIELQLPLDILNTISEERLQQWANELERAYDSYYELTSFIPYKNIIVEAYKESEYEGYAGWVFDHSNIIHVDKSFLYEDLERMAAREQDWNFCVLHEMGHMFDCDRPWNFEPETMTDLKLAYVMEKNNAAAAPAQFPASTIFYGADIKDAYKTLSADFSKQYDVFGCVTRLLQIKDEIGWDVFKQVFYELQKNEANYIGISRQEKFELFIERLSYYSSKDIKAYFSADEWNTILFENSGV